MKLEQRIAQLEARHPLQLQTTPAPDFYLWCQRYGIETPQPFDGESPTDWLKRVPTEALERVLDAAESVLGESVR
jgi:hypothetical protein